MIRLMPWEVGVRELVARPVARGRVQGLRGLTAPKHSPWFWLALWVAAAAAGFAALIPVLFDRAPPLLGYDVVLTLSGVSFAAWGLIAWRQRPDSAIGRMLTVAGFGVLVSPVLIPLDSPVAFTAAMLFGDLWIVLFVALFLSFVTGGRLTSTLDLVIVGAFLVDLLVVPFAKLLFLPDEDNLLLVWPDAGWRARSRTRAWPSGSSRRSPWCSWCRASAPTSTAGDSRSSCPRRVATVWPRPSSATAASSRCWSTTRRSTTIRNSWGRSQPRLRSPSTTRGSTPSPRTGLPSSGPRASASSPRATRSGGGSSATSTTGRSSGSCPWRSSFA